MSFKLDGTKFKAWADDGTPLIGGLLYTYVSGTTTNKATYTDSTLASPNTNPVVLDARGEADVWMGSGAYTFVLKTSDGVTVDSADGVSPAATSGELAAIDAQLRADLSSTADAAHGAGMVGYLKSLNYAVNTIGWSLKTAQGLTNALRYMPVSEWAGILDGTTTTDLTSYIQSGLSAEGGLFFPRGKWPVSATTGVLWNPGNRIQGAGMNQTIFWGILGTGGSLAQIAGYTAGSIFRRAFNPAPGTNARDSCLYGADFAIILNHPSSSITTTAIQVGIDGRNITRSNFQRIHVGNYAPEGSFVAKSDPPSGFAQQGYGFMFANVPAGASSYAGGEVNRVRDCAAWGAYKGIVFDDSTINPSSAALATVVDGCDIQGCHHSLVQEGQYTTGVAWRDNTIQNCIKQSGDSSDSYIMRMNGYGNEITGGYYECGANSNYIIFLDSGSKNNRVTLSYYSATNYGLIKDIGFNNELNYFKSTAVLPAVNSFGTKVSYFCRAPLSGSCTSFWGGSAMSVVSADGVTITRNGVGDYFLNLDVAQTNANWIPDIRLDINGATGNAGVLSFQAGTQSLTRIRFRTYSQVGGVTTQVDPQMIYASFKQAL